MSSDQNNMFLVKLRWRLPPAPVGAASWLCPDLIQKVSRAYGAAPLRAPHGRCLLADPC